jgi:type VI secretion system protein ImpL
MSVSTLLLIMIAIVLLLVGVLIFLYLVIKRSRKLSFAADAAVKPDTDKKEPAPSEFLQYGSDLELRSSFRRALRTLKTHVTGRDYRYRVPWYLLAGESQSGKTSILDSNGLRVSINDSLESNRGRLNWFFFDDGVVMDVSGDFVLRNNKTANHRGWNTILRLLQKHRPQRPLDGLVLTIPCTDLFGKDLQEVQFELEQKANCLYKKLWQAQKILGMRLPVYVLITKCDEVAGFTAFCKQLPEEFHTQMFGWSNPSAIETAYEPGLVMQAFEGLHKHLSALQFEIYAERDEIENVDDLFLFPTAMQSLRETLQVYLDCLFKQSAYHDSYLFRGLYFCGEATFETIPEVLALAETEQPLAEIAPLDPTAVVLDERKPVFLSDFFKQKVFVESNLAQPIKRVALSRNRMALTAQVLSLLIVIIGGAGLVVSYRGMVRQEAELYSFLKEEEGDLKRVEAAYERNKRLNTDGSKLQEQMLHNGETKLLAGMANINANKFQSAFIPSSWFSSINERIEHSIGAAFEYVIFESLRVDLERQGKTLLYLQSGSSTRKMQIPIPKMHLYCSRLQTLN